MRLVVTIVLLAAGAMAHESPVEVWECREFVANDWKSILVTATVDSGRTKGSIFVAGVTHEAAFQVEGFNRRWDFGPLPDGSFRYAFIVKPNGDATYVDFGNEMTGKASNLMKCRQRDAAKEDQR